MKIEIEPNEDGTVNIQVKRTLSYERMSQHARNVKETDIQAVVDDLVKKVARPA